MDTGLRGRTVLITGAGRNIGRSAALAFAREGANLVICTSKIMSSLNEVAEEARKAGVKVLAQQCDITDQNSVKQLIAAGVAEFGRMDVVVNNAGYRAEAPFMEETPEKWNQTVAVNLTGPASVIRAAIPHMQKQKWGRIINMSGISPFLGGSAVKAMVKLGIVGLTRGLAREFAPDGITANCIGPGTIDTEREPGQARKPVRPMQPIQRAGTPEEIASMMVYLASEQAAFVTGQCYLVNGGMYFQ